MYPEDSYDVSVRDRVYGRATSSHEGRRSVAVVALTVSVFVLILSLSCRQVTAPGPARNILEAGLVSLTDVDQMIADDGPALRQLALESEEPVVTIPGYPLDVVLTREEVSGSTDAQLRTLLLERSSALLYSEGIGAFDRTGEQSLRRFSLQGVLEFGVGQVSEGTYNRATFLALLSLVACTVFGAIVAATGEGWGRMRAIGAAAAAGALPAILITFLLRLLVGALGGDDPFVSGYADIVKAALAVPLRNAAIVLLAGLAVAIAAVILARAERIISPPAPIDDDGY